MVGDKFLISFISIYATAYSPDLFSFPNQVLFPLSYLSLTFKPIPIQSLEGGI